ncbi:putative CRAL-TRIO lipid binding domain, CRAL/TRIO domain superfamily [Dioscorea sansibarensis]
MGMEKKEHLKKDRERIEAVLQILKKQAPLTVKQEKFCNDACVERFLRAKGDSVKKAAKHLRAVLSWRDNIGTEHLIADEFSAELAEGLAYVAGHDDDSRPVLIFRIKQDYLKSHSQKSFVRFLVFTIEVAISTMPRFIDQFVIIFDAALFRSVSQLLNLVMGTLKITSDYYPARLHKAFVLNPPSLFPYLWKGARPFIELWPITTLISSTTIEEDDDPRTLSTSTINRSTTGSVSSRFSFTVSGHDSLKPWYLNTVAEPSPSLIGLSPQTARSYSFASPSVRSTPMKTPQRGAPRTPRPSFLASPAAALFSIKKEGQQGKEVMFLPYLRLYRRPYDEMVYRGKMKPPLGGLVSIVAPQQPGKQVVQPPHMLRRVGTSHQQRF